jgi:hypothetical protein
MSFDWFSPSPLGLVMIAIAVAWAVYRWQLLVDAGHGAVLFVLWVGKVAVIVVAVNILIALVALPFFILFGG